MSDDVPAGEPERHEREASPEVRSKRMVITAMTIAFAVAMFFAIGRGGMCERYEARMQRQQHMRNYLDSMRLESDKQKMQRAKPAESPKR